MGFREGSGPSIVPQQETTQVPSRDLVSSRVQEVPALDPRDIDPEELKKAKVTGNGKFYKELEHGNIVPVDSRTVIGTKNEGGARNIPPESILEKVGRTPVVEVLPADAWDDLEYVTTVGSEIYPRIEDVFALPENNDDQKIENQRIREMYARGLIEEMRQNNDQLNDLFEQDKKRVDVVVNKFKEMIRTRMELAKTSDIDLDVIEEGLKKALLGPLTDKFRNEDILKHARQEAEAYRKTNEDIYKGNNPSSTGKIQYRTVKNLRP